MRSSQRKPSSEPWYKDGLRFACKRCGDCCRGEPGYVWVTTRDIVKMALELKMKPEEFAGLHVRVVDDGYSLTELADGDCVMWEDGVGCRVYRSRPIQCRTFPFWPECLEGPDAWQEVARRCPAIGQGEMRPAKDINRCLRAMDNAGW